MDLVSQRGFLEGALRMKICGKGKRQSKGYDGGMWGVPLEEAAQSGISEGKTELGRLEDSLITGGKRRAREVSRIKA